MLAGAPLVSQKIGLGPLFTGTDNLASACAHCQTEIEGHGAARWRGLRGIPKNGLRMLFRETDIPASTAHAARPELRATRHGAAPGGGPWASQKTALTAIRGEARIRPMPVLCQTEIKGYEAERWRWPPGHPEKTALERYSGGGTKNAGLPH